MALAESITAKVVALAVIVLVIVSAALPVIQDAQSEQHDVEYNTSAKYMASTKTDETVAIGISSSTPTINGSPIGDIIDLSQFTETTVFWVISDSLSARALYFPAAGNWQVWKLMYYNEDDSTVYDATLGSSGTVTWSNGTVSVTNGSSTFEDTYTYLIRPSAEGDYGLWITADMPKNVDDDSVIYFAWFGAAGSYLFGEGKLKNLSVNLLAENYNLVPTDSVTIASTSSKTEHDASNELTSITASYNYSGTNFNRTMGYYFMPLEYTTISTDQNMVSVLFDLVCVLLVLVPVMIAVRMLGASRS